MYLLLVRPRENIKRNYPSNSFSPQYQTAIKQINWKYLIIKFSSDLFLCPCVLTTDLIENVLAGPISHYIYIATKYIYLILNRGGFLKYIFCLAASPKSILVATNLALNFDWKIFLVRKSTLIYKLSISSLKQSFFIIFLKAIKVSKLLTQTTWRRIVFLRNPPQL